MTTFNSRSLRQFCNLSMHSKPKRKKAKGQSNPPKIFPLHYCLLLLVTIIVAYLNAFNAGWHFDDGPNILNNKAIQVKDLSLNTITSALSSEIGGTRPISYLTFALNYFLSDLDPKPYHSVNIFLHCVNTWLVFWMIRLVTKIFYPNLLVHHLNLFSFFVASLWAFNPMQTQAVTLIVQRMTLLACLFSLLSFIFYLLWKKSTAQFRNYFFLLGSLTSLLLAFGSKENAFVFPLIVWTYEFLCRQKSGMKTSVLVIWLSIIILTGSMLFWKMQIPQRLQTDYSSRDFSMSERLLTQPRVITMYVSQLLFPLPSRLALHHEVQISTSIFSPSTTLPSILFLCILLGIGVFAIHQIPFVSFWIFWFFIGLLTESSIFPLEMAFEHRVYLPSIGFFCALLTPLITIYPRKSPIISVSLVRYALVLVAVISVFLTYQRNHTWKSEVSLWEDNAQKYPDSVRVWINLGSAHMKNENPRAAEQVFIRAVNVNPSNLEARSNLALFRLGQEKVDEAVSLIEGVRIDSEKIVDSEIYFNFGVVYARDGQFQKAINNYRLALNQNPNYNQAWFNMGLAYERLGDSQTSTLCFKEFLTRWEGDLDNPFIVEAKRLIAKQNSP